VHNIFWLN
jgi:hypothetical protein